MKDNLVRRRILESIEVKSELANNYDILFQIQDIGDLAASAIEQGHTAPSVTIYFSKLIPHRLLPPPCLCRNHSAQYSQKLIFRCTSRRISKKGCLIKQLH